MWIDKLSDTTKELFKIIIKLLIIKLLKIIIKNFRCDNNIVGIF